MTTAAPTPTAGPVATATPLPPPTASPTPAGIYRLTGHTVVPPDAFTADDAGGGWEIVAEPRLVKSRVYHKIGGGGVTTMGEVNATFTWTEPPLEARPGDVWPIAGTATLLTRNNPLNWSGSVDGNVWGVALWADKDGHAQPPSFWVGSDGAGDPPGFSVTKPATAQVPGGGKDFDLNISVQTAKSYKVVYHYAWKP